MNDPNKYYRQKLRVNVARAAALCAALVLFAAGNAAAQTTGEKEKPAPGAMVIVKDEAGRSVSIPQPVRRIVSLAPSITETLFALGAADRVVGVTDYCDYPLEAQKKEKVGGLVNPSLEAIVALRPDLVLVTTSINRIQTLDALDRLNVATYAADARGVEGVLRSIGRLAEVIGSASDGKALVAALQARLDELRRRLTGVTPSRVLFVVWQEPLISVGRDTFLADALRLAGAESIIHVKQDWPHISLEEVVRQQPEYLVFASAHAEEELAALVALKNAPGWRDLKAVQENRIVVVSDAINRPAPRLVDAIEELARQLHPAAFADAPRTGAAAPKGGAR